MFLNNRLLEKRMLEKLEILCKSNDGNLITKQTGGLGKEIESTEYIFELKYRFRHVLFEKIRTPFDYVRFEFYCTNDMSISVLNKILEIIGEYNQYKAQLFFCYNPFSNLPNSICDCKRVTLLRVDNTNIEYLPNSINKMVNLDFLGCSNTPLRNIPDNICLMPKLETIELNGTNITSLPKDIGYLKKLSHIDLRGLNLKSIPRSLVESKMSFYFDDPNYLQLNRYRGIKLARTKVENLDIRLFTLSRDEIIRYYDKNNID